MKLTPKDKRFLAWNGAGLAALWLIVSTLLAGSNAAEVTKLKATLTAVVATQVVKVSATPAKLTATPALQTAETVDTATPEPPTITAVSPTETPVSTITPEPLTATATEARATATPTIALQPTATPSATFTPWPGAPLCPNALADHNTNDWHALWDAAHGCHYDHEHGQNPCTSAVLVVFGDLGIDPCKVSHTNPSSPAENTNKHGGHKWTVALGIPCAQFEGPANCVTDAAAQMHWFGDSAIEMQARRHSFELFVRACSTACGTIYVVQLVDLGQRVSCYQGMIVPYPDNPQPPYDSPRGPYFTTDSIGPGGCRTDRAQILARKLNVAGVWSSKFTGQHPFFGGTLANFLARARDMSRVLNRATTTYPPRFDWLCSSDGGATFNPAGCGYTNSTGYVQEVAGVIPVEWANMTGLDTVTGDGAFVTGRVYVTQFGQLLANCIIPGTECYPVVLDHFPTGKYSGALPGAKVSNQTCQSNPSRDVWFANGVYVPGPCQELVPGAVPSGWIGPAN